MCLSKSEEVGVLKKKRALSQPLPVKMGNFWWCYKVYSKQVNQKKGIEKEMRPKNGPESQASPAFVQNNKLQLLQKNKQNNAVLP